MFTDFDVSDERQAWWKETAPAKFVVFQVECCPETGKQHLQGFMQLKTRERLTALKKKFGTGVHFERRKGSVKEAIAYCTKDDTRVEDGVARGEVTQQGERTDLEEVKSMIDEGAPMLAVAEEHFDTWCRNYRALGIYAGMKAGRRMWPMECYWYWGDAGSGKTRKVFEDEPDVFNKPPGKWFDGYCGQEAVLIDDFTGDIDLSLFLKILDRYPLTVEVKGGTVSFLAKRIYVTSNLAPEECYPTATEEQHKAIRRRFTEIVRFSRPLGGSPRT